MQKNKTLCIAEWQSFGIDEIAESLKKNAKNGGENGEHDEKITKKAEKIFAELENFAEGEGNSEFLKICSKNKLKAQNFVGLIQVKSGCLEILPKTFQSKNGFDGDENKVEKAEKILLNMLKTLRDSPFKQISTLNARKVPLLEIFALMFLEELEKLVKRGLKSDYLVREENRKFLKGKLIFSQNLKQNLAHKERFFTHADEFSQNIAPNRLIVCVLQLLSTLNFSTKTAAKIMQLRFIFSDIMPSESVDKDLAKAVKSRHFKHYDLVLLWCKIFLKKQSFTPYFGTENAFAMLFDMNKLFESFVAHCLRKKLRKKQGWRILAQESYQFVKKTKKFSIQPDIIKIHCDKKAFIADTKWKIINSLDDINQNDLYQIFAYLSTLKCKKGFLIYPRIDGVNYENLSTKFTFCADESRLKILFFDLDKSLKNIKNLRKIFT